MIKPKSKDFTLVLHTCDKAPVFFRLDKRKFSLALILLGSFCFFSLLFTLLYTSYIQQELFESKASIPGEIKELNQKLAGMQKKLDEQVQLNSDLFKKLSSPEKDELQANRLLPLVTGFKDLRAQKIVSIENLTREEKDGKDILKFDLYNNTQKDRRISGHIFVFRVSKGRIEAYPALEPNEVSLDKGEGFYISKFRPNRIEFDEEIDGPTLYKVFVFSNSGDLLDYQTYEKA